MQKPDYRKYMQYKEEQIKMIWEKNIFAVHFVILSYLRFIRIEWWSSAETSCYGRCSVSTAYGVYRYVHKVTIYEI